MVGAWNAGAFSYFSRLQLANLDGVMNDEAIQVVILQNASERSTPPLRRVDPPEALLQYLGRCSIPEGGFGMPRWAAPKGSIMTPSIRTTAQLTLALLLSSLTACGGSTAGGESEAPVEFLNMWVEDLASTRAVIRFDTSRPTTCEVEWGLSMDAMTTTATDPNMEPCTFAEEHEVPLEDLSPDTMIFFRAKATDPMGSTYYSETMSFRTEMDHGEPARVNVALMSMGSRIVGKSSNFGNLADDSTWGASNAIDGRMSTEWSSNGDGDDAWLSIDFGQMRDLEAFGFRSRKMTDGTSIITSIRIIIDDETTMGPFATPDPDQRYFFEIAPTLAQRVRVEAVTTTGGNTGAKEVEFFTR